MVDQRPESPVEPTGTGSLPGQRPGRIGMTGGYYWFPAPGADGITWTVLTCRDLRCGPDAGHDADLWPKLIERLAAVWGRDAQTLNRRLSLTYSGLPRGRVTRPGKEFLILHGDDSPVSGWQELVAESFHLTGHRVKVLYDEHETQLPGHPQAVEAILGSRLIRGKG